jgi:hypothetical protein
MEFQIAACDTRAVAAAVAAKTKSNHNATPNTAGIAIAVRLNGTASLAALPAPL